MDLKTCAEFIGKSLDDVFKKNDVGELVLNTGNRFYKLYQRDQNLIFEGNLGCPLDPHNPQSAAFLSHLLQFNLKRMQFLDETIFIDPRTQQLFLRKQCDANTLTEQNITSVFEDFTLNIEAIEDRFFPKTQENNQ